MSAAGTAYPQPRQDADNCPLLEGWREGRLMLQTCAGCGRTFFYPRPACPHCWSSDLSWKAAVGRGTVVSFSRIHRLNDPAFFPEVPILLAEIRLEENVATIGPGWLRPGALAVTLDYDCYWKPEVLAAVDAIYSDDLSQIQHLKQYGYFVGLNRAIGELGDVIAVVGADANLPINLSSRSIWVLH